MASRALLSLKEILEAFIRHRREVVTRRTIFDLRKARARAHVLEGLTVALANIDEMIELIKTSADAADRARAHAGAQAGRRAWCARCSRRPARRCSRPEDMPIRSRPARRRLPAVRDRRRKEILEMRLHRLTGLEQEKLSDEYKESAGRRSAA